MRPVLKRRAIQVGAVATTASALLVAGFAPAQAVQPVWPTAGYRPSCDLMVATPGAPPTGSNYVYYDLSKPKVAGLKATPIIKVGNSTTPYTNLFRVYGTDSCSGVQKFQVSVAINGAVVDIVTINQTAGTAFNGSGSFGGTFSAGTVGRITYPSVIVFDRYSSFQLDGAYKWTGAFVAQTSGPTTVGGSTAYGNTPTYLMHDVRTTVATNKTSIKKGAKVYVGGKFTRSTGSAYVNLVGATIVLQRRDKGTTKWVNVASAKTNTSGNVSIGSAPSRTADFRLSYSGIFKSPFYAPAITSTKRVSVS